MGFHGECGRGWSLRCAASKGKKCRCRCGGANHGKLAQPLDAAGQEAIDFAKRHAHWCVESNDTDAVVIRDLGPWDTHPTVTSDAEYVVAEMARLGLCARRLFYYDSDGRLDELLVHNGRFAGFAPGNHVERRVIDAAVELSISEPIACARCEIELGEGRGMCRRAKGTDICLDCAIEMDPPNEPRDSLTGLDPEMDRLESIIRGTGPIEESPSYRDAMNDAGRARQLR